MDAQRTSGAPRPVPPPPRSKTPPVVADKGISGSRLVSSVNARNISGGVSSSGVQLVHVNNPISIAMDGSTANRTVKAEDNYSEFYNTVQTSWDYTQSGKGFVSLRVLFNYIRTLHLHIYRSLWELDDFISKSVSSKSETRSLEGIASQRIVINLLTWRRSSLVLMLFTTLAACIFALISAVDSVNFAKDTKLLGTQDLLRNNVTYPTDNEFVNYTQRMVKVSVSRMTAQALIMQAWLDVSIAILAILAYGCNLLALLWWKKFHLSSRAMAVGWGLTFVAPMIASVFPTRAFLDRSHLDTMELQFVQEFRKEYSIAYGESSIVAACESIQDMDPADTEAKIRGVCDTVNMIPSITLPFCSSCATAQAKCAEAQNLIKTGDLKAAITTVQGVCDRVTTEINSKNKGQRTDIMALLHYGLDTSKLAIELMISLMAAVYSFNITLPASMSLAPGLIRGALRAKCIVPQSSIPGMFVLMLPWLYCPLAWSVYQFGFQLAGDPIVLFGLLVMSYTPMAYFFVGLAKNISKPMSEDQVINLNRWISLYGTILMVISYGSLLYFIVLQHKSTVFQWLSGYLGGYKILAFLVSATSKYVYTTIAGNDFMIIEIASQRKFEKYLSSKDETTSVGGTGWSNITITQYLELQTLMSQRNERLDELVDICKSKLD